MIKILPNTKFSYHFSRGTRTQRLRRSEEFNEQIFKRILQLYDTKTSCGIGVIKNNYNKFLPEKKNIEIVPMQARDYDDYGGSTRVEEVCGHLIGYSIELPTNVKKKLNILELPAFMHESTHVLDYLLNPKYIANYRQMCEKNIYEKEYFKIYDKYFYNTDDMLKNNKKTMLNLAEEETRKALKDVPREEKIVFLNHIKYSMEMEEHAYGEGVKFAELLQKLNRPVDNESLENYSKFLCFKEKIDIINRLIKEELEMQRLAQIV